MSLRICRFLLAALLAASSALAQSQFGAIRGVVTDPTGAPVADAQVRAVNEATQVGFTVATRDTGDYLISGLLPGVYTVTATKSGFQEYRVTGIRVSAGFTERRDVALMLGDTTQAITVTADVARLETQSTSITTDFSSQYLDRPPVIFYPSLLPAGNYMAQSLGVNYGGGQDLVAYGSRAKDARQTLDGAVLNADGSSGGVRIPRRSILEVQAAVLNADAEHATTTTAKMFTGKGTNDFHGEVWTDIGNARLNATPWYAPGRGTNTPDVRAGYRFSGPVLIPKLYNGKNRTFFHTSLEWNAPKLIFPFATTIPTNNMKGGDLRELGRAVNDPLTGQPFPNNTVPANRIHPVTRAVFDRFYPSFTGAFEPNNFTQLENLKWDQLDWFFRIDQAIGSRNNLSFSYARNRYDQNNPVFGGLLNQGRAYVLQRVNFFNISDVHVISPSVINEANFGFRLGPWQSNQVDTVGRDVNQALGLPVPANAPAIRGGPRFSVSGITPVAFNNQSVSDARFWTLRDNVSWLKGRWTTKFGVEVINPGTSTDTYGDIFGSYNFTGFATSQGLGDFLLGIPFTTARAQPFGLSSRVNKMMGFYVAEEWRASKRLTITFGGRFQYNTTPIEEQGRVYNFDLASGNLVVRNQAALGLLSPGLAPAIRNRIVTRDQVSGFPDRLVNPLRQFLPRLGFAYQAMDGTVIRAGYSMYGIQQAFGPITGGPFQAGLEDFQNRLVCPEGSTVNCQPIFTLSNPFPQGTGALGFRPIAGLGVGGVVPDMRWPLHHQANLTIQQRLPGQFVARASYILTRGTHLAYGRNINVPPASTTPFTPDRRVYPQWTGVTLRETGGNSFYQAGEFQLERRFANGFMVNGGYTLAKCLTDVDEFDGAAFLTYIGSIGAGGPTIENPYDRRRDRGNCHTTPRHVFKSMFTWDVPFGRGRQFLNSVPGPGGAILNGIIGGWTLSGFFIGQTGRFYTPYWQGFDAAGTGQTDIRPDRIGSGRVSNQDYTRIFNPDDFVRPAAGRYGNAGRGIIEGIGGARMDGGIYKTIQFSGIERFPSLRIGAQALDIFNVQPKGTFGRTAYIVTNPRSIVGRADAYFFDSPSAYNFGSWRTLRFELAVQF